jgi:hypothetical protein
VLGADRATSQAGSLGNVSVHACDVCWTERSAAEIALAGVNSGRKLWAKISLKSAECQAKSGEGSTQNPGRHQTSVEESSSCLLLLLDGCSGC